MNSDNKRDELIVHREHSPEAICENYDTSKCEDKNYKGYCTIKKGCCVSDPTTPYECKFNS